MHFIYQREYNKAMAKKNTPTIGLALGSGGAKGLAHIGVLKSLEKHNIPIDLIAGSSIGSFIGAHYARHQSSEELEKVINSFTRKNLLGLLDLTVKGGIVKGVKTEKFIADMLKVTQFQDLKIPFAAIATDLNTAESVVFTQGDLTKIIRASTSIPAFYQPIVYKERLLADGGLSDPIPVDVARKMGADIVVAVNLDQVYGERLLTAIPALSKMPRHAINILQHNLALHSVKTADVIITPQNTNNIGFMGWSYIFDTNKAGGIIEEGERATDEAIPQIRELIEAYKRSRSPLQRVLRLFTKH
jgi:NTE family protein